METNLLRNVHADQPGMMIFLLIWAKDGVGVSCTGLEFLDKLGHMENSNSCSPEYTRATTDLPFCKMVAQHIQSFTK
jgi:hypothetical protein